jgi:hypothetical protein
MKWTATSQSILSEVPPEVLNASPSVHLQTCDETVTDQSPIIHLGEEMEATEIVRFLRSKKNGHLLQKNKDHFNEDLQMTAHWLEDAQSYFENSCLTNPTHKDSFKFTDKSNKAELRDRMVRFIDGVQGPALPDAAVAIFEELFMNATIDAPKEAQRLGMPSQQAENEFILERHAKKLVISCRDSYGTLDVQKFLDRMAEVYEKGAGEAINMNEPGGAGLGCVILFENCTRLIIGSHRGRWTKVTCILPIGCSQRQRAEMKKSLHRIEVSP